MSTSGWNIEEGKQWIKLAWNELQEQTSEVLQHIRNENAIIFHPLFQYNCNLVIDTKITDLWSHGGGVAHFQRTFFPPEFFLVAVFTKEFRDPVTKYTKVGN